MRVLLGAGTAMTLALCLVAPCEAEEREIGLSEKARPLGEVRVVFASDSAIASYNTWDAPGAEDQKGAAGQLRRAVDDLADNGVDVLAQLTFASQGVGFFWPEHPDHIHRTYSRIDRSGKKGVQPIEVLIDQCHKRGMKFLAKFRVSDRHRDSARGWQLEHKELWLDEFPGALDFSHAAVRDWYAALVEEILRRFDVDGFEFNYVRWEHCFPTATARENQPVMTAFLGRVRALLDARAKETGRELWLGVRVPQTLEECHALGYDVPTWIKENLINYVAPCDFFYPDFNARYEEFAALTRPSKCRLFPAVHPLLCWGDSAGLMRPDNNRALARNMYAAGADGVSVFNYMYHWARRGGYEYPGPNSGYPLALSWLRELRDPEGLSDRPRHYLFYPLWGDTRLCPTGVVKNDHILLKREVGSAGEFRFRIAEDLGIEGVTAEVYVTARKAVRGDKIVFSINGSTVPGNTVKSVWNSKGRPETFGRPLDAHMSFMWRLTSPPAIFGDNVLAAKLVAVDPEAKDDIIIDEIEVTVLPHWEGRHE